MVQMNKHIQCQIQDYPIQGVKLKFMNFIPKLKSFQQSMD